MLQAARLIPPRIRKAVLREGLIDIATDIQEHNSVFEYLFDVYETFIDSNGEHNDWECGRCRSYVLGEWRKLQPYLVKLEADANVEHSYSGE
jgi:hypothetical protein